jgi:hypothetical protein
MIIVCYALRFTLRIRSERKPETYGLVVGSLFVCVDVQSVEANVVQVLKQECIHTL